jgi:hypothetical protein
VVVFARPYGAGAEEGIQYLGMVWRWCIEERTFEVQYDIVIFWKHDIFDKSWSLGVAVVAGPGGLSLLLLL